ncbi:MAG: hypothetical protein Q7K65_04835 [Candidatus Buchananbacteria bacterium]|nr:hypothetical protein [Candidatus Buchananbacteria bacterium]
MFEYTFIFNFKDGKMEISIQAKQVEEARNNLAKFLKVHFKITESLAKKLVKKSRILFVKVVSNV